MNSAEPPFDFQFDQEKVEQHAKGHKYSWPSPELIRCNNQFGLGRVFAEYAGLPEDYPLRVAMEHTVLLGDQTSSIPSNRLAKAILTPSKICSPPYPADIRPIPVGFGYLYVKKLFEKKFNLKPISDESRKGTLVFPFKFTKDEVNKMGMKDTSTEQFIAQLKDMDEKFQPVFACLYFAQVPELAPMYRDAGIPVVTAGHRLDPMFFYRFHDLCRRFRYAASNKISAQLFLTVSSGCRFFYIPGSENTSDMKVAKGERDRLGGELFYDAQAEGRRLFSDPVDAVTTEQQSYVNAHIGEDCFVSPKKLRSILLREQKRYENRPWWHGERQLLAPPESRNFIWQEFPNSRGWHGLKIDRDTGNKFRWIGATNKAWLDLRYPTNISKHDATISVQFIAITCDNLEVYINDEIIPDLKFTQDGNGGRLEGKVPAQILAKLPPNGTMRVSFHAEGNEITSAYHRVRPLSAAISGISIKT